MSDKICIIGAGCSGFTMAKRLKEAGLAYDQFEASDDIGGNWYHNNPNGMSACYQSLHIDTSKYRLAFEDFPVPDDWPDFPHHSLMLSYFHDYVAHFGLREHIRFNTRVDDVKRDADGLYDVTLSSGESRRYRAVVVANGHHWDPKTPTEYQGRFEGLQFHSHAYDSPFAPHDLRGKRVLIVGVGNSAMDIASEVSQRPIASKCYVSTRRGVWVLPKYLNGQPADKALLPGWVPMKLGRLLAASMIKKRVGAMENFGLPKPDHDPLTAHPSVSGEFLTRLGSGDIEIRPGIERLRATGVDFTDGSSEEVDVIIWATGYKISFPFLKQNDLAVEQNRFPLYRRMLRPGWDNLFFVGLAQPLPTLVNLAEQQSKFVLAVLQGKIKLPSDAEMERRILQDEKRYLGHYYNSERHTIQIDFNHYVADLRRDLGSAWTPTR
jgi:cation diffusion facilitator CzcD-associated flavoprotein CzcO